MKNENFHDVIYVKRTEANGIIVEITSPSISFTLLTLIFYVLQNIINNAPPSFLLSFLPSFLLISQPANKIFTFRPIKNSETKNIYKSKKFLDSSDVNHYCPVERILMLVM